MSQATALHGASTSSAFTPLRHKPLRLHDAVCVGDSICRAAPASRDAYGEQTLPYKRGGGDPAVPHRPGSQRQRESRAAEGSGWPWLKLRVRWKPPPNRMQMQTQTGHVV